MQNLDWEDGIYMRTDCGKDGEKETRNVRDGTGKQLVNRKRDLNKRQKKIKTCPPGLGRKGTLLYRG